MCLGEHPIHRSLEADANSAGLECDLGWPGSAGRPLYRSVGDDAAVKIEDGSVGDVCERIADRPKARPVAASHCATDHNGRAKMDGRRDIARHIKFDGMRTFWGGRRHQQAERVLASEGLVAMLHDGSCVEGIGS